MRYCGKLGFADKVEETAPSVFTEKMTERTYYGDVLEFGRQMQMGDKVNPDITVGNQLSILADPFANDHLYDPGFYESEWKRSAPAAVRRRNLCDWNSRGTLDAIQRIC